MATQNIAIKPCPKNYVVVEALHSGFIALTQRHCYNILIQSIKKQRQMQMEV